MKVAQIILCIALGVVSPNQGSSNCPVDYVVKLNSDVEVLEKLTETKKKGKISDLYTDDMGCLETLMRKNFFKSTTFLLE